MLQTLVYYESERWIPYYSQLWIKQPHSSNRSTQCLGLEKVEHFGLNMTCGALCRQYLQYPRTQITHTSISMNFGFPDLRLFDNSVLKKNKYIYYFIFTIISLICSIIQLTSISSSFFKIKAHWRQDLFWLVWETYSTRNCVRQFLGPHWALKGYFIIFYSFVSIKTRAEVGVEAVGWTLMGSPSGRRRFDDESRSWENRATWTSAGSELHQQGSGEDRLEGQGVHKISTWTTTQSSAQERRLGFGEELEAWHVVFVQIFGKVAREKCRCRFEAEGCMAVGWKPCQKETEPSYLRIRGFRFGCQGAAWREREWFHLQWNTGIHNNTALLW